MKKNSQGWYIFADGTCTWFFFFFSQELKVEIQKHGKLVSFEAIK